MLGGEARRGEERRRYTEDNCDFKIAVVLFITRMNADAARFSPKGNLGDGPSPRAVSSKPATPFNSLTFPS